MKRALLITNINNYTVFIFNELNIRITHINIHLHYSEKGMRSPPPPLGFTAGVLYHVTTHIYVMTCLWNSQRLRGETRQLFETRHGRSITSAEWFDGSSAARLNGFNVIILSYFVSFVRTLARDDEFLVYVERNFWVDVMRADGSSAFGM